MSHKPSVVHPPRPRGWQRRFTLTRHQIGRLSPEVKGVLWTLLAGFMFVQLNTMARLLTGQLPPFESQFLRYLCGVLVMLPLVWRHGVRSFMPNNVGGQFTRGIVHTVGLGLWFVALPKISLAEMTAISFMTPIFIMLGAWLFLRETMHWERWLAAAIGFSGVIVVMGPNFTGHGSSGIYSLIMLASVPMFAASFLITKALTRYETPGVIVLWQALTVTVLSIPLALMNWQTPTAMQWLGYLACGVLGSAAHYCLTRAYALVDISATQSLKFLELVWASLMGWLVFSDAPAHSTLLGGLVISVSTLWIARRESRRAAS